MNDIEFLKELRGHVENVRDVTRREMALKMIGDWIEELESTRTMNAYQLDQFFKSVREMRRFQKAYFKDRLSRDMHVAKQWEKEVDKWLGFMDENDKPADAVQEALL